VQRGFDKTFSGFNIAAEAKTNVYPEHPHFGIRGGPSGMSNYEYDDERRVAPPLHSEKIVSDRKIFFLDLKENDRGRFIKITEDVRGRRDTIMLPMEVAEEFLEALQRCVEVDHEGSGS
jgi:hypothetical protein